jgi:Tfp pilus assembly PilM family ATPase
MKLDVATLSKRWKTRGALAVTISSQSVGVTLLRRENGMNRVIKSFVLPIGAETMASDPAAAGTALAEQLDAQNIKEKRCVVCVPAGWALTAAADLPELAGEDLRGYLELKAEREFTLPLSELRFSH